MLTLPSAGSDGYQLRLIRRDNHLALQYVKDVDVAVLNTQITHGIWSMDRFDSVRYEVFVPGDEFRTSIFTWTNKGKPVDFSVDITIYGPARHRDHIGNVLSDAGLYLQHPRCCSNHVKYDNPHYLVLPRSSKPVLQLPSPSLTPEVTPNAPIDLTTVLDGLDQRGSVRDADIDMRIKTPLLSHQKTGVDFIAQKEGRKQSSVFSLWEPRQREYMTFHEHVITGTRKSSPPNEAFGGILADDMGLGKSSTVLSAIVGSLDFALPL
ncbi:hypothetical protein VTN77DRAFT_2972 [Rasamsonia byssochlamydoides]|uniref:uncharacterized protein n=1 Tax=Rasamsonia byssochlamydoides TaxID=89139 RepID=UPI0037421172